MQIMKAKILLRWHFCQIGYCGFRLIMIERVTCSSACILHLLACLHLPTYRLQDQSLIWLFKCPNLCVNTDKLSPSNNQHEKDRITLEQCCSEWTYSILYPRLLPPKLAIQYMASLVAHTDGQYFPIKLTWLSLSVQHHQSLTGRSDWLKAMFWFELSFNLLLQCSIYYYTNMNNWTESF